MPNAALKARDSCAESPKPAVVRAPQASEAELASAAAAVKKAADQLYGKPGLYRLFNQIPNRLKEKFGHTLCRELTTPWQTTWLCRDHALFCRDLI